MRILILSASIGGGHDQAARAIASIVLSKNNSNIVKIIDTLQYINPILNKTISDAYLFMAKNVPKLFGSIYNATNKYGKFNKMVFFLNGLFSKKILPLVETFSPEIIVSTHMFPTEMVSSLKSQKKLNTPLVCIITDYTPHKTWINKEVDAYITACNDMLPKMTELGIEQEKIYPFGIPVNKSFFEKNDKQLILKELELNENSKTILIMAGSFGVRGILPIYTNLMNSKLNFQTIVITGKNKKLFNDINKIISDRKHKNLSIKKTKLIYFTDKVYKLMKAADLIITKPGGLTVSEALASGLPMAVFDAIPGQEEANADFIIKNKMGIKINKNEDSISSIEQLLTDNSQLQTMKNSCITYKKNLSVDNIYELLENIAKTFNPHKT